MNASSAPSASRSKPQSAFPKQAIVVVHGIGEQRPMDTIRAFVRAAWESDTVITKNGLPNEAEVWSKPDFRTGSLELRRITTRQSIASNRFPSGIRSDFYELYWADLSGGSTWDQVKAWIFGLLFRNPFTHVPRDVFLAWVTLWALTLAVVYFAVATALPKDASVAGVVFWKYIPLVWISELQTWQLAAATALIAFIEHQLVVPYFGRVVRYTRATPENIAARNNIRERGLKLLSELHNQDYDRIVVVGHSLGSILAYDIVSYFWAARYDPRTVTEGTAEFAALQALEQAAANLTTAAHPLPQPTRKQVFLDAQRAFLESLRTRPKPKAGASDQRWIVTDLITLGSPLSHAEFLLAHDVADLERRQNDRELPICPPLRELLDPAGIAKAKAAGFHTGQPAQLLCFPFGSKNEWQLHHAAPFAAVRWTNIYDHTLLMIFGDLISGEVGPAFGPGVVDVDLRSIRGQSWRFTHTLYWALMGDGKDKHIAELRKALDLTYSGW